MKTQRLRPFLLFLLATLLPAIASAQSRPTRLDQIAGIVFTLVIAVVVSIIAYPYVYRFTLKRKGEKNLRSFLLNDPRTRDLLLESRGIKPKAQIPAPTEKTAPNPPTDPTPGP